MTDGDGDRSTVDDASVDRRRALTRLALGSGAVVAGAIGGAVATGVSGGGWKRHDVAFDVACLGETWRDSTPNWAENESDFRGAAFSVEGWLYPIGTIPEPGDGFIPTSEGAIGRWLCRGNVLLYAERPEPHVQTSQEFVFGFMTPDQLFPDDLISTSGIEGTLGNQVATRSVIGGTGRYLGATGDQRQITNGFNTSQFADGSGPGQNFQMVFRLLLPDF